MLSVLSSTRLSINSDDCTVFSSNPYLAEKDIFSWPSLGLLCFHLSPKVFLLSLFIEERSAELGFLLPCTTQSFTLMRAGFQLLYSQNEDSRQKLWARLNSNLHLILDEVPLLLFSLILALFQCCFRVSCVLLLCCGFVP